MSKRRYMDDDDLNDDNNYKSSKHSYDTNQFSMLGKRRFEEEQEQEKDNNDDMLLTDAFDQLTIRKDMNEDEQRQSKRSLQHIPSPSNVAHLREKRLQHFEPLDPSFSSALSSSASQPPLSSASPLSQESNNSKKLQLREARLRYLAAHQPFGGKTKRKNKSKRKSSRKSKRKGSRKRKTRK